jgi:PAS domain S-box-containing protein
LINVPLQRQQRVIGVLAVNNAESDRTFSQSDVLLLSALADAATIAIENAQRYARTDQQLHHTLEELAAVQHKTDLVLEHISEGVVTVTNDLYITSVNAAIERITGWQASELLGCRYEEVLSPLVEERSSGPEQTIPRRALDSRTAVGPTSATLRHRDGGHIPVILTATSLRASDASVTGALVTVRDLTQETNRDNRHQEILDMLDSQGLQLDQLTEETLDTLHMEAGTALPHCHPVTLKPIVSQIIRNYQETGSGGPVQVALAPDLPFAMGNESQIELALLNLVENARGSNADKQPVVISADVQDDRIVISVEGPGSAVPHEQHQTPLNSLRSSDNSGDSSGDQPPWWILPQIRLFIARKLIQAQGGQFWTENQPGTTMRFHFSLPKIEVTDDAQALID